MKLAYINLKQKNSFQRQSIATVCGDVKKNKTLYIVCRNANFCSQYRKYYGNSQEKIKNKAAIWSANPTTGCISKGDCLILLKRHVHSYYSTVHNNQNVGTMSMSNGKVGHRYTHETTIQAQKQ